MLVVIMAIAYRSTRGLIDTVQRVRHTSEVLEAQDALISHLLEADRAAHAFLLTGEEMERALFHKARAGSAESWSTLKTLTYAEPEQQERLEKIHALLPRKFALLESAMDTKMEGSAAGISTGGGDAGANVDAGAAAAAASRLTEGGDRRVTEELRGLLHDFREDEDKVLARSSDLGVRIGRSTRIVIALATAFTLGILTLATVMLVRDIAARRRAEEALADEHNLLRSVMDAMPHHVFVKDPEGRYVIDNLAHRSFVGAKSLTEVAGRTVFDFFPRDVAQQFSADDRKVLDCQSSVLNQEEPVPGRGDQMVWLSMTKVPLRDTEGRCKGLVCVSTDVSTRRQAEDRLRLTAERLRRSNEELEQFASVASHDLQEPLRKIQAFGDRLQSKCSAQLGEGGRDYLERILDAARRMQTLIQDLLTLSRITSKAQPFVETDLGSIVKGVISDLEVRIEQTAAQVEIGRLPTIEADPMQMRQLFQNLIANALKFQRPGAVPEVIISGKLLETSEELLPGAAPGDTICQIRVIDNGVGFDEKYAERIFQVFQRLYSRSEYEGTGIGLAVCRKIVGRHGGVIAAKSAEGQGATFIVTMPVKQSMKTNDEETPR